MCHASQTSDTEQRSRRLIEWWTEGEMDGAQAGIEVGGGAEMMMSCKARTSSKDD